MEPQADVARGTIIHKTTCFDIEIKCVFALLLGSGIIIGSRKIKNIFYCKYIDSNESFKDSFSKVMIW